MSCCRFFFCFGLLLDWPAKENEEKIFSNCMEKTWMRVRERNGCRPFSLTHSGILLSVFCQIHPAACNPTQPAQSGKIPLLVRQWNGGKTAASSIAVPIVPIWHCSTLPSVRSTLTFGTHKFAFPAFCWLFAAFPSHFGFCQISHFFFLVSICKFHLLGRRLFSATKMRLCRILFMATQKFDF